MTTDSPFPARSTLARLASAATLLLLLFAGTRALVRALPGDPLDTLIAESGTGLPPDTLRAELGLDRPYARALAADLAGLARGDLGVSLLSRQPVAPLVARRFARTLALASLALGLSLVVSVALGVAAAGRPGGPADLICTWYGALAAALPIAWIGPLLLVVFAVWLPLFPVGNHVLLPALTLALAFSGLWSRLVRERVRETLARGAAPGARARGIREWKVLLKYGLAPASGALAAYLGTQFGNLLAGAFVTELIFDWRGMGTLLVESVLKRDYPVIEAAVFVAAAASFAGTFAGDWLQSRLDPRQRLPEGGA